MQREKTALLVGLIDPTVDRRQQLASLKEAELLLNTYGAQVTKVMTQNLSHLSSHTFIGAGKVQQVKEVIETQAIDIMVINHHLKAGQLFTLKEIISPAGECEIWDRTELILQIFSKHAHTAEAKLQIKLAKLQHHGPELTGIGKAMSQQAGGIGTRGIGETTTEVMSRHFKEEVRMVKEKLLKVAQNRRQQMKYRKSSRIPTVSIIGYTNAGKTSLFNRLSSKQDKVENALFATLDSSVSSLYLPNLGKKIFITDTIGFIQDLPTLLINAFTSTLMETVNSEILLHVIDCSDPQIALKINTVTDILGSLHLGSVRQIILFNKKDRLTKERQSRLLADYRQLQPILVSAKHEWGIDDVVAAIQDELLSLGYTRADHLSYIDDL
jgi:GTP-binding protein HflX